MTEEIISFRESFGVCLKLHALSKRVFGCVLELAWVKFDVLILYLIIFFINKEYKLLFEIIDYSYHATFWCKHFVEPRTSWGILRKF